MTSCPASPSRRRPPAEPMGRSRAQPASPSSLSDQSPAPRPPACARELLLGRWFHRDLEMNAAADARNGVACWLEGDLDLWFAVFFRFHDLSVRDHRVSCLSRRHPSAGVHELGQEDDGSALVAGWALLLINAQGVLEVARIVWLSCPLDVNSVRHHRPPIDPGGE